MIMIIKWPEISNDAPGSHDLHSEFTYIVHQFCTKKLEIDLKILSWTILRELTGYQGHQDQDNDTRYSQFFLLIKYSEFQNKT